MDTPYYLCNGAELQRNCDVVSYVRERAGCRVFFAIKSFSVARIFPYMAEHFDGVVSSSLYESRLGRDHFCSHSTSPCEVNAYSPAFKAEEIDEVLALSDTVIFNSHTQLERFHEKARAAGVPCGLRLNPQCSGVRPGLERIEFASDRSRLGVVRSELQWDALDALSGVLFHVNSENEDLECLRDVLRRIEQAFGDVLKLPTLRWVSLGGGISFTDPDYPVDAFVDLLREFSDRYDVTLHLEPGSAISSSPFTLHATVLDVVTNQTPIAVLDVSAAAHLPDRLVFGFQYPVVGGKPTEREKGEPGSGFECTLAGNTCLGDDDLGVYRFDQPLEPGDEVVFTHAGDYTMVQQTFFNGVRRPSVYYRSPSGELELIRKFDYADYLMTCR